MAIPPLFSSTEISPTCNDAPLQVQVPGNSNPELVCTAEGRQLNLEIIGGIPPFIWATLGGVLIIDDDRHAHITIHEDPTMSAGLIHYLQPHVLMFSDICEGQAICGPGDRLDTVVDVRFAAYDCMFLHVVTNANGLDDNIPPFFTSAPYAHPIGDVVGDRSCILTPAGGSLITSPTLLDQPNTWSVSAAECFPTGLVSGNAIVNVTALLAGKNGMHGTIHAASPSYSGNKDILPIRTMAPGCSSLGVHLDKFITNAGFLDIRTQEMVDAECCIMPSGSDITITVVDAIDNVAIIVIPVV